MSDGEDASLLDRDRKGGQELFGILAGPAWLSGNRQRPALGDACKFGVHIDHTMMNGKPRIIIPPVARTVILPTEARLS